MLNVRESRGKRYGVCVSGKEFNSILARITQSSFYNSSTLARDFVSNKIDIGLLDQCSRKMIAKRYEKRKQFGKTGRLRYIRCP
jgi:hypothetical protein